MSEEIEEIPVRVRVGSGEEHLVGSLILNAGESPARSLPDFLRALADEYEEVARRADDGAASGSTASPAGYGRDD